MFVDVLLFFGITMLCGDVGVGVLEIGVEVGTGVGVGVMWCYGNYWSCCGSWSCF